jgi:hypothetical protein
MICEWFRPGKEREVKVISSKYDSNGQGSFNCFTLLSDMCESVKGVHSPRKDEVGAVVESEQFPEVFQCHFARGIDPELLQRPLMVIRIVSRFRIRMLMERVQSFPTTMKKRKK